MNKHKKFFILALSNLTLLGLVFFVPPDDGYIVSLFIFVFICILFMLSSFFLSRIDSFLIALLAFLACVINYSVGFNILNTVLLLSFVLGIRFLIQ